MVKSEERLNFKRFFYQVLSKVMVEGRCKVSGLGENSMEDTWRMGPHLGYLVS